MKTLIHSYLDNRNKKFLILDDGSLFYDQLLPEEGEELTLVDQHEVEYTLRRKE